MRNLTVFKWTFLMIVSTNSNTSRCRQELFSQTMIFGTILFLLPSLVFADNRYAVSTGDWNATSTWSLSSGGSPGALIPVAGDNVFIGEAATNRTVTIPDGYAAACATVTMGNQSASTAAILNFASATSSLTVSENVVMNRPGGAVTSVIGIGAGTLIVNGDLELARYTTSSAAASRVNQVNISTGTLNVVGNLIFGAENAAQSQIVFSGAGVMNLAGNFTFTSGTLTPGTGTTNFNGTNAQIIPIGVSSVNCGNLTTNNTHASGATLSAAMTSAFVTGHLSVQARYGSPDLNTRLEGKN